MKALSSARDKSQRGEVKSHDQVKRMVRSHAKRRTNAAKRERMAV